MAMTAIRSMRYDEVAQVLTVEHRDWGGIVRYFEVHPAEWAALNAVFAKAAYLQRVLQPGHRSEQLQAA